MRTWATSSTSDHTSVVTGLPDSASKVAAPTNCRAAAVGTTRTSCPDSVKARTSRAALYAATPPATPSTMRLMPERTSLPPALKDPLAPHHSQARGGTLQEGRRSSRRDPAGTPRAGGPCSVLAGGVGEQAL